MAYFTVKAENFIYFLKECEQRKKFAYLNNSEKLANLQFILTYITDTVEFNLFSKENSKILISPIVKEILMKIILKKKMMNNVNINLFI